jgi:hypothetical protein
MLWHGVQACTAPGLMQIDQTCVSEVMCMASCGTLRYGVWQLFQRANCHQPQANTHSCLHSKLCTRHHSSIRHRDGPPPRVTARVTIRPNLRHKQLGL